MKTPLIVAYAYGILEDVTDCQTTVYRLRELIFAGRYVECGDYLEDGPIDLT